jgi:hypothetical protein
MVFHHKKMKCKEWLKLTGPDNELLGFLLIEIDIILPGLVYSHTAMHNLLGCRAWLVGGLPLVMCVSAPAEIPCGVDSLSQLISASRPGLEVARWKIKPHTDELKLKIFREVPLADESGLLDAIVLSVVLLRSGQSLGDSPGDISLLGQMFRFK